MTYTNIENICEHVESEYWEDNIDWEVVDYDEYDEPIYSIRIGKEEAIRATFQFSITQCGECYILYDEEYNGGAARSSIVAALLKTYHYDDLDITEMVAAEIVRQIEHSAEHDLDVDTVRQARHSKDEENID
jgi:hypothetical protein